MVDNNIMEKSIKITYEGKETEVVLKQLTWGDHKRVREESIVLKEYKGRPMQFRNTDLMDDLKILASIKSGPFKDMEELDKLSESDRYKLAMAVIELDEDVGKSKSN